MHRSRTFYLLAFSFFSLSLHQRNLLLQVSFLSLYSRLNIAVAHFLEEQLLDFRLFNPLN